MTPIRQQLESIVHTSIRNIIASAHIRVPADFETHPGITEMIDDLEELFYELVYEKTEQKQTGDRMHTGTGLDKPTQTACITIPVEAYEASQRAIAYRDKVIADLQAELLRVHPQPSRDKLDLIFKRHHNAYNSRDAWLCRMKYDLMDWARGEMEKEWCSHIPRDPMTQTDCWLYRTSRSALWMTVPDSWDQCPDSGCHAKRPEERE